jgi:EAL domain-containing protein (putative c-di-GMP-specific phosphodiesterase class I)
VTGVSPGTSTAAATIDEVVDARAVTTVFQPIVRLDKAEAPEIVGMEALTRGPRNTPWETPLALFEAAREAGRAAELDWVCRASAYRAAIDHDLPDGITLFVNAEPGALGTACPPDLAATIFAAQLRLRVVTEFPERSVADPLALLAAGAACRDSGGGIALDDVGHHPGALALLTFLHPDVVKLDLRVTQAPQGREHLVNAVRAYAERSGATILAEGIETAQHLATARTLGATLGQGYLFDHPGPLQLLGNNLTRPRRTVPFVITPPSIAEPFGDDAGTGRTPYESVTATCPTAEVTKRELLALTRMLEARAMEAAEPAVLLACFQEAKYFTPATATRYARYAEQSALVMALATELPSRPATGVRGVALSAEDPLRGEWNVVAVGPHFAGALVARDLGDRGPDGERRFAHALTYDRELVLEAARTLLHWV